MDFSDALKALKAGNTIARQSWASKGTHYKGLSHDPDFKFAGENKSSTGRVLCRQVINGSSYDSHMSLHERDVLATDWLIISPLPEPDADTIPE